MSCDLYNDHTEHIHFFITHSNTIYEETWNLIFPRFCSEPAWFYCLGKPQHVASFWLKLMLFHFQFQSQWYGKITMALMKLKTSSWTMMTRLKWRDLKCHNQLTRMSKWLLFNDISGKLSRLLYMYVYLKVYWKMIKLTFGF